MTHQDQHSRNEDSGAQMTGGKGDMDISEHERTWDGFMAMTKIGTLLSGALVAWLTMWLALGMNWFIALALVVVASIVVAILFR